MHHFCKKKYEYFCTGSYSHSMIGESLSVAQNSFVSTWCRTDDSLSFPISKKRFKGKDLAFALGVALSLGRLGSGLNFLCSATIASAFGTSGNY